MGKEATAGIDFRKSMKSAAVIKTHPGKEKNPVRSAESGGENLLNRIAYVNYLELIGRNRKENFGLTPEDRSRVKNRFIGQQRGRKR